MPFSSQKQNAWAFATHQPFAKEWAAKTDYKTLPKKAALGANLPGSILPPLARTTTANGPPQARQAAGNMPTIGPALAPSGSPQGGTTWSGSSLSKIGGKAQYFQGQGGHAGQRGRGQGGQSQQPVQDGSTPQVPTSQPVQNDSTPPQDGMTARGNWVSPEAQARAQGGATDGFEEREQNKAANTPLPDTDDPNAARFGNNVPPAAKGRKLPGLMLPPLAKRAALGTGLPGTPPTPPMPAMRGQRGGDTLPPVVPAPAPETPSTNAAARGMPKMKYENTTSTMETGPGGHKGPAEIAVRPKTGQMQILTKPNAVVQNPHPDPVSIYPTNTQGIVQPITNPDQTASAAAHGAKNVAQTPQAVDPVKTADVIRNAAKTSRFRFFNAGKGSTQGGGGGVSPLDAAPAQPKSKTASIASATGNLQPDWKSKFYERMLENEYNPRTGRFNETGPLGKANQNGHGNIGKARAMLEDMAGDVSPEDQQMYSNFQTGKGTTLPPLPGSSGAASGPTRQATDSHSWSPGHENEMATVWKTPEERAGIHVAPAPEVGSAQINPTLSKTNYGSDAAGDRVLSGKYGTGGSNLRTSLPPLSPSPAPAYDSTSASDESRTGFEGETAQETPNPLGANAMLAGAQEAAGSSQASPLAKTNPPQPQTRLGNFIKANKSIAKDVVGSALTAGREFALPLVDAGKSVYKYLNDPLPEEPQTAPNTEPSKPAASLTQQITGYAPLTEHYENDPSGFAAYTRNEEPQAESALDDEEEMADQSANAYKKAGIDPPERLTGASGGNGIYKSAKGRTLPGNKFQFSTLKHAAFGTNLPGAAQNSVAPPPDPTNPIQGPSTAPVAAKGPLPPFAKGMPLTKFKRPPLAKTMLPPLAMR